MPKQRRAKTTRVRRPITNEQAENEALAELEAMTPRQVLQSLVDAGIYTPTFKFTKKYRWTSETLTRGPRPAGITPSRHGNGRRAVGR